MSIRLFLFLVTFLLCLPGAALAAPFSWQQDYEICPLYQEGCSNFPHIKTFGLLYGGRLAAGSSYAPYRQSTLAALDPEGNYESLHHWFADHYDLTSEWGGAEPETMTAYNPNLQSWQYMTLGGLGYLIDAGPEINLTSRKALAAHQFAKENNLDIEDFFIHFALDKSFDCEFSSACGASFEAVLEDVAIFKEGAWLDWTPYAFGYLWGDSGIRKDHTLKFGTTDSLIYFGKLTRFTELHVNLSSPASADWSGRWEYWNGTAWTALTLNSDTTGELQSSGMLEFIPPADWAETLIPGHNPYEHSGLYYIRLRTLSQGSAQPVAHTYQLASGGALQNVPDNGAEAPGVSAFRAEKFLPRAELTWEFDPANEAWDRGVSMQMHFTFPGWSELNDQNHDGYVDDTEFAALAVPAATARMRHQARSAAYMYQYMSYAGNYTNSNYRSFVRDFIVDNFDASRYQGIMFDSLSKNVSSRYWGGETGTFIEYPGGLWDVNYYSSINAVLGEIQQGLPGVVITGNNNLSLDYIETLDGSEGECFFDITITNTSNSSGNLPTTLTAKFDRIIAAAALNKQLTVMTTALHDPAISAEREKLFGLAAYYLIDENSTYFWYQGPYKYSEPWNYWFDAIEYDIGASQGRYYQWATGLDPSSEVERHYYIFARNRADGNKVLVKFKPKSASSHGDDSLTTHDLGGEYYLLSSDGTLSESTVSSISLRNNEGAILISPASLPPTVTPTPEATATPLPEITPTTEPSEDDLFAQSKPAIKITVSSAKLAVRCALAKASRHRLIIKKGSRTLWNRRNAGGKAKLKYRRGTRLSISCQAEKTTPDKVVKSRVAKKTYRTKKK